jgi:phosphatidylinositol 4-kinase
MVQATKFLLRWLYLNNLINERAEIQSMPYIHPNWHQQDHQHQTTDQLQNDHRHQNQYQHQQHDATARHRSDDQQQSDSSSIRNHPNHISPQRRPQLQLNPKPNIDADREWKRKAIQSIALYPPGSLRLLALDTLRLEIVHEFARELHNADEIVHEYCAKRRANLHNHGKDILKDMEGGNGDPYLDADLMIISEFEKASNVNLSKELCIKDEENQDSAEPDLMLEGNKVASMSSPSDSNKEQALLAISPDGRSSQSFQDENSEASKNINEQSMTNGDTNDDDDLEPRVLAALALQRESRDYLPQLVSAILHSPAPLTQSTMYTPHLNPLATLRRLLITRCVRDPNLGIELCWLLEAEVGRAWKSLFEHRQQTGRRLIVVLPADRAAAIQQIGSEKRAAFDLLQDVESATAYGVYGDDFYDSRNDLIDQGWDDGIGTPHLREKDDMSGLYSTARLPASLSLKRCSHFGDTMHFIDLLTKISLDLRLRPLDHREDYLVERLEELNRRLRRRMISKGNVSLDVEDNRGPHDWPTHSDLSPDSMKYSIHFPLEPTATVWPGGQSDTIDAQMHSQSPLLKLKTEHGEMRVLNIVSAKGRVLASRERCPYLVHCEVLETGLEGRDARLYAAGSEDAGITLQEALGLASSKKERKPYSNSRGNFASYRIPSELSPSDSAAILEEELMKPLEYSKTSPTGASLLPRGGDQFSYHNKHPMTDESGYTMSPYDLVREEQLQQLHEHFQTTQQHPHYGPPPPPQQPFNSQENLPALTTYSNLLDGVFGKPWAETCEEIRRTSPYGNVNGWRLASFIMKAGEDIRREALVMQVISKMKTWFETDIPIEHRPFLKPYTIMCVGGDAGLLECLRDAKSIDEVKKSTDGFTSLRDYFERAYGPAVPRPPMGPYGYQGMPRQAPKENVVPSRLGQLTFEQAQDNFLRSLVGYSLVCYILQIKDRHNANILLDREGHIMHIDFGFVLGDTPKMGKVPLFSERAPFKLTQEFWEVIGGWNFNEGGLGVRFCKMFEEAFACASAHCDELVSLIEAAILNLTQNPIEARMLSNGVRHRLRMRGPVGSVQQKTFIMDLVNTALTSWGTSTYDWLQKSMNGYI